MCIKLIDVLSSHSSLIQMRIDTDLITYLSHVLLPVNMVQKPSLQQPPVMRGDQGRDGSNAGASDKLQFLMGGNGELSPTQKGLNFFQYQEAAVEDTQEKDNYSE